MQSALKDIICPDVLLPVIEKSGVRSVSIKETGADAKLTKLHITGLSPGDFAFSLDYQPTGKSNSQFLQLSCYLDRAHDKINKGCDFVLLCEYRGQTILILGEMKSSKPKANEVDSQLRNSELFIEYLLSLASEWHNVQQKPKIRKVCIHSGKQMAKKRPTKRRIQEIPPQKSVVFHAVKAPSGTIKLNQILS